MNNNIKKFTIISIAFSLILGTLLHFTYELSGENLLVASFSAVNESTWEHLKLVFYPMLITSIIGYFVYGKNEERYWCIRMITILFAISFITVLFYTYIGIIGGNFAIIDILVFIFSIILGEWISYELLINNILKNLKICNKISIYVISILLMCFIIFTYKTPNINYFKDPITSEYGMKK